MKKTLKYNKKEKSLCVYFPFTDKHKQTLLIINNNEGVAEFENRFDNLYEDVDGNEISWQICDELVEMGLLIEDEESYDVFYEISEEGIELIKQM